MKKSFVKEFVKIIDELKEKEENVANMKKCYEDDIGKLIDEVRENERELIELEN